VSDAPSEAGQEDDDRYAGTGVVAVPATPPAYRLLLTRLRQVEDFRMGSLVVLTATFGKRSPISDALNALLPPRGNFGETVHSR
jgi:hypothetical protein